MGMMTLENLLAIIGTHMQENVCKKNEKKRVKNTKSMQEKLKTNIDMGIPVR